MRISDSFIVCISLASLIADVGIAVVLSASIVGSAGRGIAECDVSTGVSAIRGAVVAWLDTDWFTPDCAFE
jgi:hypothetical protein